MKVIIGVLAALLFLSVPARAQGELLLLYSPAVVDSVSGDTIQPALAHSIFTDTVTVADSIGYSILTYLRATRWPDSVSVGLHGIGEGMRWKLIPVPKPDSVEGLNEAKQSYQRKVWWSGKAMLEDSVITPGKYEVSGDSLVEN